MLSSDKNVEHIAQLVEVLKDYVGLQGEYLKLNVIEKAVKLVTALAVTVIFIILGAAVLLYLSFAAVYWLEPKTGTAVAFFIVSMFFLFLLLLVSHFRKSWIERPLVRFLTQTLLN